MNPENLGSWIIVLTFIAAFAYLIREARDSRPLALAAQFSTAVLLVFVGLLFAALMTYVLGSLGFDALPPLLLALLVPLGSTLGALIRHQWRRTHGKSS